jgi:pantetheine-phosphate adenylyltransferase
MISFMPHALFPGTFDPPTLGHLDVARRAAALFDEVTIGLADHPEKRPLFSVEERLALLGALVADLPGVRVERITGLVVDAARALGATVLVRGVRNSRDFDYEVEMARTNRVLAPAIDTVLVVPDGAYAHITSTLVRQISRLGGDTTELVPPAVHAALVKGRSAGG